MRNVSAFDIEGREWRHCSQWQNKETGDSVEVLYVQNVSHLHRGSFMVVFANWSSGARDYTDSVAFVRDYKFIRPMKGAYR